MKETLYGLKSGNLVTQRVWYTEVCMKNIRRIVLFGSYASGKPTRDSDLDFLVVMPTCKRWSDRVRSLHAFFPERLLPIDFVVRTLGEIRERLTSYFCPSTREVLKTGKVLYEVSLRRS